MCTVPRKWLAKTAKSWRFVSFRDATVLGSLRFVMFFERSYRGGKAEKGFATEKVLYIQKEPTWRGPVQAQTGLFRLTRRVAYHE